MALRSASQGSIPGHASVDREARVFGVVHPSGRQEDIETWNAEYFRENNTNAKCEYERC